ncbi:MAG: exodeoxyribonuclease VII large subunit [Phycisphaeraceae bacterium]
MGRLPFNPDFVAGPDKPAPRRAAKAKPLRVAQVAGLIRDALASGLPTKIQVVGEVSNLSDRHHWFFSLKDGQAAIRCVCFASAARRVRCRVADGLEVVATGRIDFYDAQGHVQLYVDKIEPVGQGALELELRELMEELREAGYFDASRKKPLPLLPRKVAVVTSRSAAALQDVIETARKRWPGCRLLLSDVRVQGEAAAPEIARAIERLSAGHAKLGIDAILVTRGGGSIEDLWAFNERIVADALQRCPLPVVAAIGHETDTTVAELVADLRCSTPTQAAMNLIPEKEGLDQQLDHYRQRLARDLRQQVRHARSRLDGCAGRSFFRRPGDLVDRARRELEEQQRQLVRALPRRVGPEGQRLAHLEKRLLAALPQRVARGARELSSVQARLAVAGSAVLREPERRLAGATRALEACGPRLVKRHRAKLDAAARHLEAVSPKRVLDRGYSLTRTADGRLLRKAADARPGERITTVLAEGEVRSVVEGGEAAAPAPAKPKRQGRKKKQDPPAGQESLFGQGGEVG